MSRYRPFAALEPFVDDSTINVIVETPAGSGCKYKYDEASGLFTVGQFLPAGFAFPFDFGFVPGTRAADGDPLDALLIAERGTAQGCLVPARLLGVLQAERSGPGSGPAVRNDRILAIPLVSREYAGTTRPKQLPRHLREEIDHFLTSYGILDGKVLRILRHRGPGTAARTVRRSVGK